MKGRNLISIRNCVLYLGLSFTVLAVGRWIYTWEQGVGSCLLDIWTIISLLMAVILLDMYRLKPAASHTITSLLIQYACHKMFRTIGTIARIQYTNRSKACKITQTRLLMDILKQNKETVFCKDFGLDQVHSLEDFRRCMPLTTYNDYLKYVEMVTESGCENVLFPGKANFVALTSGTTSGKSKAYPKSQKSKTRIMRAFMLVQNAQATLGIDILMKMAFMTVRAKISKSKSGIDRGPISTLLNSKVPYMTVTLQNIYGEFEVLYIHILFALREDDIANLATQVATTALTAFRILEQNWESLCDDIETGRIMQSLDIPENERHFLNNLLKPCPDRANFLRKEFSKGFENIVPRIWPSCPCFLTVKTGVYKSAGRAIEEKYLGKLPCVTLLHIGTETVYGTNIHPLRETTSFAPFIDINVFEFIPEEEMENEKPQALLSHQVEIGRTYELVITTYDGLYRYRTEDMVQIVEFFHTTPLYKFVRRAGDILSVDTDKVPEFLLYDAVNEAAEKWRQNIVDFTSCESIHVNKIIGADDDSKHYFVLIETETTEKLTENEEKMVDEMLCRRHELYAAMRKTKTIRQLRFIQLKPGTFLDLKKKLLELNPSSFCLQVKIPRILRREKLLQFVLAQRI